MVKRVSKPSVAKLKKKVWEVFSRYIRTRDCLLTTGTRDEGRCFTCNALHPFKELQAGHFIPGRHNGILFDERGVHAQCYHCNVGLKGNPIKYFRLMQQVYGETVIRDLERLDATLKDYTVPELECLLLELQAKLTALTQPYYEATTLLHHAETNPVSTTETPTFHSR